MAPLHDTPVSWPVSVAKLPDSGRIERFAASPAQCRALAGAHDLLGVDAFEARFEVRRFRRDGAQVKARLKAQIVQACVVTLEPVPAAIDIVFEARFVPVKGAPREQAEIIVDPDGDDPPEPFTGTMIDLGALAEEHFVLALDPYPRLEGAEPAAVDSDAEGPRENPFAALKALRGDR